MGKNAAPRSYSEWDKYVFYCCIFSSSNVMLFHLAAANESCFLDRHFNCSYYSLEYGCQSFAIGLFKIVCIKRKSSLVKDL